MKVYLISTKTLKQKSLINDSMYDKYIMQALNVAQDIDLKQVIGKFLLDKICDLCYEENEQHIKLIDLPQNSAYKYLLQNYITDYLCYSTMSEIQIPVHTKMVNNGITQNTDTNFIQSSLDEVTYMKRYWMDKAEFVGNEMQKWILKNRNDYPEFFTQGCGLNEKQEAYACGIVL